MLNRLDDYPIHQTAEPIAQPASGDRNFYDRYFLNGYTRAGDLFFAAALGLYPNRRVMDAAFSVVRDGRQHVLRASQLAVPERTETRVGPIAIDILEPMRALRLRVAANDAGLEADLVVRARTVAIEEPRFTHRVDGRLWMDATRFTQFGAWEGWIAAGGERVALAPDTTLGTRDRSWGVRSVGERPPGPPGAPPQFFWLWAPLHFDDLCTHFAVNEYADGRPWHRSGSITRVARSDAELEPSCDDAVARMAGVSHEIRWQPGTRRAAAAALTLEPWKQAPRRVELEPILHFQMSGLGYAHPEWGHGMWKSELAVAGESFALADVQPMHPQSLHVQTLCRARLAGREGLGVLEQLVIGPHEPSGFREILDPAR